MERAHSFSTSSAVVLHSVLDVIADFDKEVLRGSVQITVRVNVGAKMLVLDTNHLDIFGVRRCLGSEWTCESTPCVVSDGAEDVADGAGGCRRSLAARPGFRVKAVSRV